MRGSTIIIILGSLGFIIMGLISISSNRIKTMLKNSGAYNDIDKFMKLNGTFNIAIGILGIIIGVIDYFLIEQSKYVVISFIVLIAILSLTQNITLKKYKNI